MAGMYTPERLVMIEALITLLQYTEHWDNRYEVAWYVDKCVGAGFCKTSDQMRMCAQRYILGKRKVNPPGTARRKREAKRMREIMANVPKELQDAVDASVLESPKAVEQYKAGIEKVLNSLVGAVMRKHKADPAIVRELLIQRISK